MKNTTNFSSNPDYRSIDQNSVPNLQRPNALDRFENLFISEEAKEKEAGPERSQGNETDFGIEISNTEEKPTSMFKSALPSLKLNIENKLSPD